MDLPPSSPQDRKTCIPCTKAKRRCDKGIPVCQRCLKKGLVCQYSSVRPYTRLGKQRTRPTRSTDEALGFPDLSPALLESFSLEPELSSTNDIDNWMRLEGAAREQPEAVQLPLVESVKGPRFLDTWWFSGPEAWIIDGPTSRCHSAPPNHVSVLNLWIDEVREWLRQWIQDGHNAFIHEQLYSNTSLPTCLQDCWSALAAYMLKTKSNSFITMSIVQARAESLTANRSSDNNSSDTAPMLRTIDHLARVQALFIYQFIRLFDGDIRQRALAEQQFFVLQEWCERLWESAVLSTCSGDASWSLGCLDETNTKAKLWENWLLGESIRRTWYLCKILHAVYFTLRDGWAVCPGAIRFTARKDVWEASSSTTWAELAQNRPLLLLSGSGLDDDLFTTAKFKDVDKFSRLLLQLLWGTQRVQDWAKECPNT